MDSTKGRIMQKAIICNVMLACITLVDFFMTVFFKTRFSRIAEKTVLSLNFRHSFTVRLVSHQSGTHGVREISSTFKTKLNIKVDVEARSERVTPLFAEDEVSKWLDLPQTKKSNTFKMVYVSQSFQQCFFHASGSKIINFTPNQVMLDLQFV